MLPNASPVEALRLDQPSAAGSGTMDRTPAASAVAASG